MVIHFKCSSVYRMIPSKFLKNGKSIDHNNQKLEKNKKDVQRTGRLGICPVSKTKEENQSLKFCTGPSVDRSFPYLFCCTTEGANMPNEEGSSSQKVNWQIQLGKSSFRIGENLRGELNREKEPVSRQ